MDFVGGGRSGSGAGIQTTFAARCRIGRLLADCTFDFCLVETRVAPKFGVQTLVCARRAWLAGEARRKCELQTIL